MRILLIATFLITSFAITACNVNKRDPKTPTPTIKKVSTDFFFEFSKDRKTYKSRRFLFGKMIENKTGRFRDYAFDHYNRYASANIEFDYNEDGTKLIGRMVNPSYPNDKNEWKIMVEFPIASSYYEENSVDPTGRTENDRIRREDRSDPKARPYIDLELSGLTVFAFLGFHKWASINSFITKYVEDIEWSVDGKFLGFTAHQTNAELSNEMTVVSRFNFLRIDNPGEADFEETAYNKENDRYTQILYHVGERPNHFGEKLKAVHWDINSKTKKKYKFQIHNFPKEYEQVAIDSIESWNDVFLDVVGYKPFEYEISNRKYSFDLRYHTIHWVDSIKLSAAGPLGVANTAADITNGKVLWTQSVIWGGMLDTYAAMDVPSSAISEAYADYPTHNIDHAIIPEAKVWNRTSFRSNAHQSFEENFVGFLTSQLGKLREGIVDSLLNAKILLIQDQVAKENLTQKEADQQIIQYRSEISSTSNLMNEQQLNEMLTELLSATPLNEMNLDDAEKMLAENPITWEEIVDEVGLNQAKGQEQINLGMLDKDSELYKNLPKEITDSGVEIPITLASFSHDQDDPALDTIQDINSAITASINDEQPVDVFEVKRTMIRKTIVHEIGHTLGLAHNFKSNIMPAKGSVPNKVYNSLKKKADQNMINKSSIMGYPDGRTVVATPYTDMVPGPHDINRIQLLYNQQYPMYDKNSKGESDYVWTKLEADGLIKDQITKDGKKLTPGYLPGCNDIEASFYMDPFCNRHDRGYNAETLAQNYFERYEDTLHRLLESNIDSLKSRNYQGLEYYLWRATGRTLTRTRLFYDFMRLKYGDEIKDLKSDRGDIFETYRNLFNFSKNCRELIGKNSDELSELRSQVSLKPFIEKEFDGNHKVNEFGDLCIATTKYFDNITKYLEIEGQEYTEIDYFNRRVPGGMRYGDGRSDYDQMFGSWKRMTLLPLKFKIMQNVLMPRALFSMGRGDYLLYPYGRPDTSFSLATLFPEEYLNVIQLLTESSMKIEDSSSEPRISRSLMYLGYFLRLQNYTADYKLFPSEILDSVAEQTRFRFSIAFVEVEANKIDNSDFAKTFKGSIYNRFNSNGKESLGNMYLFSLDRYIFKSQANSLALPVTPIRWRTPSRGYSVAYKLDYAPNINFEELEAFSPRNYFINNYKNSLESCIKGDSDENNGLSSYFKTTGSFEGIKIPIDIHERPSAYKELNESIVSSLDDFVKEKKFNLSHCETALRRQRALVLGASLMNGYYFPETNKYLEQGSN